VPGLVAAWIVRVPVVAACVPVGSTLTEHGASGGVGGELVELAAGLVAVGRCQTLPKMVGVGAAGRGPGAGGRRPGA